MGFFKGSDKQERRRQRRAEKEGAESDKADKSLFGNAQIELSGLDNVDLSEDFNQPLVRGRSSDGRRVYKITLSGTSSTAYNAVATAQLDQSKDVCGNFTLASSGARSVSGSLSADDCW